MTIDVTRRRLLAAAPAVGFSAILAGCAATTRRTASAGDLFRIDDEAVILAAARAIIAEDPVAALITLDEAGVPRVRSVGVSDPKADLTMWIGTRRTSRKVRQLRANPNATLYFNFDDLKGNTEKAYYASFMGVATVHTDEATLKATAPDAATLKAFWPNYPDDFASIRFKPLWLEVTGHGIRGDKANWQPQAVVLPR